MSISAPGLRPYLGRGLLAVRGKSAEIGPVVDFCCIFPENIPITMEQAGQ